MDDASTLDNNVGQNGAIASNQLIFNPLILIPTLGCLVLSVIIPLIFKPFHVMNIDVLPYSATSAFSMFILIITGLIPHWSGGDVWLWVIRFLILLVCICGTFIITNRIVNKILANTNYASAVVNEFNKIEADKKPYRSSLKKLSEEANEKDKMKYVEEE